MVQMKNEDMSAECFECTVYTSASVAGRSIACCTRLLVDLKWHHDPQGIHGLKLEANKERPPLSFKCRRRAARQTLGRQTRDEETTLVLPVRRSVYAIGHCHPRGM